MYWISQNKKTLNTSHRRTVGQNATKVRQTSFSQLLNFDNFCKFTKVNTLVYMTLYMQSFPLKLIINMDIFISKLKFLLKIGLWKLGETWFMIMTVFWDQSAGQTGNSFRIGDEIIIWPKIKLIRSIFAQKSQNEDEIISWILTCLTLAGNKLRIPLFPALNHMGILVRI